LVGIRILTLHISFMMIVVCLLTGIIVSGRVREEAGMSEQVTASPYHMMLQPFAEVRVRNTRQVVSGESPSSVTDCFINDR
jgi:hypothetical protein